MNLEKIIHTLNLASSDTRDETLKSIIECSLDSYGEQIEESNLSELINSDFGIKIHEAEITEIIIHLKDQGRVKWSSDNKLYLPDERKQELLKINLELSEKKQTRKLKLFEIVDKIAGTFKVTINTDEIINVFCDYLYECFLQFGRTAVSFFIQGPVDEDELIQIKLVTHFLQKLGNKDDKKVLKALIEQFPEQLDSEFLSYLQELAKKAECFFSLGLKKELYDEILNLKFVDWVVFLDTNFLYSILNLHRHPENKACHQLVRVIRDNNIQVKFYFTVDTQKELQRKRNDFRSSILSEEFTPSQLKALIKSDKLDEFSKNYFIGKLEDPDGTPHPTEIIDKHLASLKQIGIEIYQSKLKHIKDNQDYLDNQISKFRDYERFKNEVRLERGQEIKTEKDDSLLEHDILLREAILSFRDLRAINLNEIKYFGLSLDKALIGFDKREVMSGTTPLKAPTFFLPSYLLCKIIKFLPLVTDDYRRAFVAAISSVAFEELSKKTSLIAQQSVRKFHKMGINDEKLILSCISQNIFLEDFNKKEETGKAEEFIESEIGKKITNLQSQIDELSNQLSDKDKELTAKKEAEEKDTLEKAKIKETLNELVQQKKLFSRELAKAKRIAKSKSKMIVDTQKELEFQPDEKRKDIVINVTKIWTWIKKQNKKWIQGVILTLNIFLIICSVIIGIIFNEDYKYAIYLASIGITLILKFIPNLRDKIIIHSGLNTLLFAIYTIFIVYFIITFQQNP